MLKRPGPAAAGTNLASSLGDTSDPESETRQDDAMDILKIIAAVILPPLGVALEVGLTLHFWLNILLTLFGYIPGIVHAIWIIATR